MNTFELKAAVTEDGGKAVDYDSEDEDEDTDHRVTRLTWRHAVLGPVIFLYFSGLMASLFVMTQYAYRRVQMIEYPNKTFEEGSSYCTRNMSDISRQNKVQQTVSQYLLVYSVLGGVPAIFVNIILGASSDRYGRKFVFILSITGTLIRMIITLIGVVVQMDLRLFGVAFFIEGLCGQPFNFLLAVYSYASDVTTRKNRAIGIVVAELCVGLGATFSPFAMGFFIQAEGFKDPIIVCIVCIATSMLLVVCIVPESFPKERRAKRTEACINIKNALGFYFSSSNAGKRWKYNLAIIVFFLTMVDLLGRNNVEILYQMNAPFCWTPQKLGWYSALRTGLQQVIGMMMVVILKKFLAEETIALVGCVSFAAAFVIEAMAKTDTVIYIVTVVGSCGVLTIPMTRTILSKMTSPQKQGALAASISAVETTCNMSAVVIMTAIYRNTVQDFGGAAFVVMAAFNVIAFILITILKLGSRRDKKEEAANNLSPISMNKTSSADM